MVQSQRVSAAAAKQRILRQSRERHVDRSRTGHLGLLSVEGDIDSRTPEPAISRRDFQSSESRQLQHSESDRVYSHRSFGYSRSGYQHLDCGAASAIWIEINLVGNGPALASIDAAFSWAQIPLPHPAPRRGAQSAYSSCTFAD